MIHRTDLLTSEQLAVLRNLGGWMIADALIAPERGCAALRTCMWGGTYNHDGEHAFFECAKRGIVVYAYTTSHVSTAAEDFAATYEQALGRTDHVLVRWSQITRYASALSAPLHDQLRSARTELQRTWLAVCGPTPAPGRRPAVREPAAVARLREAHRAAARRLDDALIAALPLWDMSPRQLDLFESSA